MNKQTVAQIQKQIDQWKRHMELRSIGHDLYFVDPNGRQADLNYLNSLKRSLEEAKNA